MKTLFLQAKQAGARYVKNTKRVAAGAAVLALSASPAFAQTAPTQPDVGDVVTFILGSMATMALIGNATLLVRVSGRVYAWVRSMIR